jgi:uncharacterized spore protein YtfJ
MLVVAAAAGLALGSLAVGQDSPEMKPPAQTIQPANDLADGLARRLSDDLHVKTVVGKPMLIGSVTVIPILMAEVTFGGAGMAVPAAAPAAKPPSPPAAKPPGPPMGGEGFFMSGEVRPLGFVVITTKGARFISVPKTPAK